ncbi:NADase-type glycan-binding domain-containing protein [Treponema pedis]|uniref:NADase-type glycan-binding domain-containing protein n=1 Tax=Treponema pedis TaxID=409322 RepID=UPI003B9698A5
MDKAHPFKYTIQNAFDGNPVTSYVEDTEDDTIKISLYSKELNLNCIKIKIINGYAQNEMLYKNNNRIKVIDSLNEKSTAVTLKDENLKPQIINWIDYSFYVKDLYKGKKYNDTYIAELDFQSENGNWIFEN